MDSFRATKLEGQVSQLDLEAVWNSKVVFLQWQTCFVRLIIEKVDNDFQCYCLYSQSALLVPTYLCVIMADQDLTDISLYLHKLSQPQLALLYHRVASPNMTHFPISIYPWGDNTGWKAFSLYEESKQQKHSLLRFMWILLSLVAHYLPRAGSRRPEGIPECTVALISWASSRGSHSTGSVLNYMSSQMTPKSQLPLSVRRSEDSLRRQKNTHCGVISLEAAPRRSYFLHVSLCVHISRTGSPPAPPQLSVPPRPRLFVRKSGSIQFALPRETTSSSLCTALLVPLLLPPPISQNPPPLSSPLSVGSSCFSSLRVFLLPSSFPLAPLLATPSVWRFRKDFSEENKQTSVLDTVNAQMCGLQPVVVLVFLRAGGAEKKGHQHTDRWETFKVNQLQTLVKIQSILLCR